MRKPNVQRHVNWNSSNRAVPSTAILALAVAPTKTKVSPRINNLSNSREQTKLQPAFRGWIIHHSTHRFNLTVLHSKPFLKTILRRCTEPAQENRQIRVSLAQDWVALRCTAKIPRLGSLEAHPVKVA